MSVATAASFSLTGVHPGGRGSRAPREELPNPRQAKGGHVFRSWPAAGGQGRPRLPAEAAGPAAGRPEGLPCWLRSGGRRCPPGASGAGCHSRRPPVRGPHREGEPLAGEPWPSPKRLSHASGCPTQGLSSLQKLRSRGLACPWQTLSKARPSSRAPCPLSSPRAGKPCPSLISKGEEEAELRGAGGSHQPGARREPSGFYLVASRQD